MIGRSRKARYSLHSFAYNNPRRQSSPTRPASFVAAALLRCANQETSLLVRAAADRVFPISVLIRAPLSKSDPDIVRTGLVFMLDKVGIDTFLIAWCWYPQTWTCAAFCLPDLRSFSFACCRHPIFSSPSLCCATHTARGRGEDFPCVHDGHSAAVPLALRPRQACRPGGSSFRVPFVPSRACFVLAQASSPNFGRTSVGISALST